MASTYLTRTPSSAGNRRKFTFSAWLKLSQSASTTYVFQAGENGNNDIQFSFQNSNKFYIKSYSGGSLGFDVATYAKYRDCSGWYHFVVAIDTEQSTASNRAKIYVNGELVTSLVDQVYCSQNTDLEISNTVSHNIGASVNNGQTFDGSMSHVHFCDGYQYQASDFGSFDNDTGEWSINTSPNVNYGTTGFTILKDGNTITDQSSNSNNWTVGAGSIQTVKDCPDNVYATWNPLNNDYANNETIFENGNTKASTNTDETAHNTGVSTLAMPVGNGKFYAEIKCNYNSNTTFGVGVIDSDAVSKTYYQNYNLMNENQSTYLGRVIYSGTGATITGGGVENQSYGNSYTDGDIIGIACDMENGAVYFSKNGVWQNSGNPASGASKTGAVDMSAQSWYTGTTFWHIWCGKKATNNRTYYSANFGNGTFGTTSVSSAGTPSSTPSTWEYDCPSGYEPLSTKGLNI